MTVISLLPTACLRDFSRVVASTERVEDIVSAMRELHPDRDNPRVVWHCAREAVKKRRSGVPIGAARSSTDR